MKRVRVVQAALVTAVLSVLLGCQVGSGDASSSGEVRDRLVAEMDCDERLMEIKALSTSTPAEETYRRLDDLARGKCSTHQGILEERFIVSSSYRIGAPIDELIHGIHWRSSANRELLAAMAFAAIQKDLTSPSADDVIEHFSQAAPNDFLPRLLRAQRYQQRDDISGVDKELQAATELLDGRKSETFQIERSQLAPIFFLEGRIAEAYDMSMDFVRLYGDEAWNSPDMIGIAAMSAVDLGKPNEAKQLLDELRRRRPDAVNDPAIVAASATLELKYPELL